MSDFSDTTPAPFELADQAAAEQEVPAEQPAQSEQPEADKGRDRKRGARRPRRGKASVDAATVRLVLGTDERIRHANVEVRDAAARVLRVPSQHEALTEALLSGDDAAIRALTDLVGVSRSGFEQAMIDLAALESPDRVRSIWQVLCAVKDEAAAKLPADSLSAALQVARGVSTMTQPQWSRAERVLQLLEG